MSFLREVLQGRVNSQPITQSEYIDDQIMQDILEKDLVYSQDELYNDDETKQLQEIEGERVKPWRKQAYKEQIKDYMQRKHQKTVKVSNRYASKIYKKMYDQHILNNPEYATFDKISLHPDLTVVDNEFLGELRSRSFNYALVGQFALFVSIYFAYKHQPSFRTNKACLFIAVSPPIALFSTFYLVNFFNGRKIINLGLDKKYKINP